MNAKHITAFTATFLAVLMLGSAVLFVKNSGIKSANKQNRSQSASAVTIGPTIARVTVVEFFDFQCPYCKQAHPTLMRIMKEYENQPVRFMFRHFPLISNHPLALPAANASLCANEQSKFFPYATLLFEKQDELSASVILSVAQETGIALEQFTTCLAEKRYESLIREDVRDALALGIEGTPTWYINDTRLKGALSYETFKTAIEKELNK